MGFPVYDFRTDIRNVLVTPQIRSRFLRVEPGEPTGGHTHDLGHEVFLVLQGRALFEIDGETSEVGPGQMCVALANQMHSLSAIGDEPVIMYLSVTPHIHPTHTMWDEDGNRRPHRFAPPGAYDTETDDARGFDELLDGFVRMAQAIAKAAREAADQESALAPTLKGAVARGDERAARSARDAMWDAIFPVFELAFKSASEWNDLAPRAVIS